MNPQLSDYVRQQLASGVSKESVTQALLQSGWQASDVNEAVASFTPAGVPIPRAVTPMPTSFTSSSPVAAVAVPPKPQSMKVFEWLMYASILIGVAASVFQYAPFPLSSGAFLVLLLPLLVVIVKVALVFYAAHRRNNVARIILLVILLFDCFGLLGIFAALFTLSFPIPVLLAAVTLFLEITALCFAFSAFSNKWFNPGSDAKATTLAPGEKNAIWSKGIPLTNAGFLLISLLLVFGLDLSILQGSPELAPFFYEMLGVLLVFAIFCVLENYVFPKRFATTASPQDKALMTLVVVRNIVFVLNFIPFIQLLGAGAAIWGGIPFVIGYSILISSRSKSIHAS